MATADPTANGLIRTVRGQDSMRAIVWRQFRRHPAALFALTILTIVITVSVLAPIVAPYDPNSIDLPNRWAPPSFAHWLGTDKEGRDTLSRIPYGGRISLIVGFFGMGTSMIIGIIVGGIAGYRGGWVDSLLMRITDFFLCFPQIFILLFISAVLRQLGASNLGSGLAQVVAVIGLTSWMAVARLVRGGFLKVREEEFIAAARSYGTHGVRLVFVHILPNAIGPLLVAATRGVADAILLESGLSFLGYGIQPPTASWGNILQDAFTTMGSYPWITFWPGFMIFITILALNYLGDGLRDALDPFKFVGPR